MSDQPTNLYQSCLGEKEEVNKEIKFMPKGLRNFPKTKKNFTSFSMYSNTHMASFVVLYILLSFVFSKKR